MRKGLKLALTGALCSATLATAAPEAIAGPMSAPDRSLVAPSSSVENIWYRRGYRGYRRGYYNPGAAVAATVGLGLLGAGLAASSGGYYGYPYGYGYYPGYYYSGWGYPYGGWGGWGGWGGGWGW
jgi:hypothetical protein